MVEKPLAEILCEQLSRAKLTKFVILPHIYASGPGLFSSMAERFHTEKFC